MELKVPSNQSWFLLPWEERGEYMKVEEVEEAISFPIICLSQSLIMPFTRSNPPSSAKFHAAHKYRGAKQQVEAKQQFSQV